MPDNHWAIILAGGNGERLQPAIEAWLGERRPKQYCTFTGTRSMIQHTLDRALMIVPPERLITIVARSHETHLRDAVRRPMPGLLIRQPSNRGTSAGIFLPLSQVMAADPNATVFVFPSDHFIYPEDRFADWLRQAAEEIRAHPHHMILLGVRPSGANGDYGWILPQAGRLAGNGRMRLQPVSGFCEKPQPETARELMHGGALWNTMILVTRARTLWMAGLRSVPRLMRRLLKVQRTLPGGIQPGEFALQPTLAYELPAEPRAQRLLDRAYLSLPQSDFSADVLAHSSGRMLALEMDEQVVWSDWGRTERITESLRALGRSPHFAQLAPACG